MRLDYYCVDMARANSLPECPGNFHAQEKWVVASHSYVIPSASCMKYLIILLEKISKLKSQRLS